MTRVPEDVDLGPHVSPRADERTAEAMVGFPRATVHLLYNATAPVFREVVFR